jgi:hypothetical protein
MNWALPSQFMSKRCAAHEQLGETHVVGMPRGCVGLIHPKVGGIQVLARLAPSSQTLGS